LKRTAVPKIAQAVLQLQVSHGRSDMNIWDEGNAHDTTVTPLGATLPGNMVPLASQAGIKTLLARKLPIATNS
jgi:hypothetical protein